MLMVVLRAENNAKSNNIEKGGEFFKCLANVVCSNGELYVLHLDVWPQMRFVNSFLTGVLVARTNIYL